MSVVTVRVPRELKEKMQKYKSRINWSDEIRKFIENKVLEIEREEVFARLDNLIRRLPQTPRGTAEKYLREDRDSN